MRKELYDADASVTDNEDLSLAKRSFYTNGTERFYVKISKQGSDAGFFLNPQGMWFNGMGAKPHDKRTRAVSLYEFKQVKKDVFDLYIHFLKTKNQVFLRRAEQESING